MSEVGVPEPSEIFAEMDAQPPLKRGEVAGMYLGKEVYWSLLFANADELSQGGAWLLFRFDPDHVRMVVGTVRLIDYPSLRSLRVGETVFVRGRIRKIDILSIELEIQDIVLLRTAEAIR